MGDDVVKIAEMGRNYKSQLDFLRFVLSLPEYKGKDLFWVIEKAMQAQERKMKQEDKEKKQEKPKISSYLEKMI